MNLLGNIIWLLFGGFFMALGYLISGTLMCITIIGIPFGIQIFKLGIFALLPFGQQVIDGPSSGSCLSIFMNVLWILIGGIWIFLSHITWGILFCITIIGIPFGKQHFKLALIALTPFGKQVIESPSR